MDRIAYGEDYLRSLPLIDGGGTAYLAAIPTIATGDMKLWTDTGVGVANPTAKILGFDSGSTEPSPGDVLDENGAGTATCVVMFVVTVAGAWGSGTASGFMFVKSVSGEAWADNDQIDNTTESLTDIATVDAGTTGVYTLAANQLANTAGLFAFANKRAYFALTAEEVVCQQGWTELVDQTETEEWEDTSREFETEDHPSAMHTNGCIAAGVPDADGADYLQLDEDKSGLAIKGTVILITKSDVAADVGCMLRVNETGTIASAGTLYDTDNDQIFGVWNRQPTGTNSAMKYKMYSDIPLRLMVNAEADTALSDYDPPTKAEVDALLTTAMTEAYSTDGGTVTVANALYEILAMLHEFSISGTTLTAKKRDGSTTAFTCTLNSATTPTSITRAT